MLRNNVLRKKSDFSSIYKKGRSVGDRFIVLFYRPNYLSHSRTAFLASKKVGNSVKRNRARRLMKESFRLTDLKIPEGYDFIFIARNTIADARCADVRRSLESALRRSGVIRKES